MKKLLVTDYDGTFIRSDGTVSQEQIDAVNKFVKNGNVFAVITGRMTSSILPLVRKLGLRGLVASFNGGEVTDIQSGEHLYTNFIDSCTAEKVFLEVEKVGAYAHGYHGEDCFCQTRTNWTNFYEKLTNIEIRVVQKKLSDYFKENSLPTKKILVMDDKEILDRTMPLLEKFSNQLNVVRSNDNQIEITDPCSTKGYALEYLAKAYDVEMSDTYAVGDGGNDSSMLIKAGTGYAVSNAESYLKEVADVILNYSNNQDAVKKIIELI